LFDARPGQTLRDAVIVSNSGDASGSVRLYAVDATTGRTTGAVYVSQDAPRLGVGVWTSLGAHTLTLRPSETRTVQFAVRVPASAPPGQHLGGLVAENLKVSSTPAQRGRASFRINIRNLSIIALQVDLPGQVVERMTVTSVTPGPQQSFQTLLIAMRNTGNQLLKGSGQLVIHGKSGGPSKTVGFNIDTFVPGTAVSDPVALPGRALPTGSYAATVAVPQGHGRSARLATTFTISSAQLKQVFGSQPARPPGSGSSDSSVPLAALIAGGLALFAAGAGLSRVRRTGS
jgi:hypothetical protein